MNIQNSSLKRVIDLRSDTITKPTPAMRRAMADAEVGDDVFGDDPTAQRLEARTAEVLGKEAALFVPSAVMANQLAIRCQTEPGDEILVENDAHIYYYESGAMAALSGVIPRCIQGERGVFSGETVRAALRPRDVHFPPTRLVCVENTHNRGGGKVWSLDQIAEVAAVARENGLRLHLDGARLWNAAVASGTSERAYAAHFDTVSVCFSKALGAPIGSALAGSREFIERARRFRKQFGGGMRQVGIIAAGALLALEEHRARLGEDHTNARALANGLRGIPGIQVDPEATETNMVFFGVAPGRAGRIAEALRDAGILVLAIGPHRIRAVTSLMVTAEDIRTALDRIRSVPELR